jgi:hypothetical protein
MKLRLKALMKDKNVLYAVAGLAALNVMGYLMLRDIDAVLFFCCVGLVTSYFSKNMIAVMGIALVGTNLMVATRRARREGFSGDSSSDEDSSGESKDAADKAKDNDKDNDKDNAKDGDGDAKKCKKDASGNCLHDADSSAGGKSGDEGPQSDTKESFAPVARSPKDKRDDAPAAAPDALDERLGAGRPPQLDYAGTLEKAYTHLDRLLDSDAIKKMGDSTASLATKQRDLMASMENIAPLMAKATEMMDKFDKGGLLSSLLGGSHDQNA